MSTTLISVDQYLHGMWEPDREYVNGEVLERNRGKKTTETGKAPWCAF